jgi:hypothetical protein
VFRDVTGESPLAYRRRTPVYIPGCVTQQKPH